MTKRFFLLFLLAATSLMIKADPIAGLLNRILPVAGDAEKFEYALTDSEGDEFTISCDGEKVFIEASNELCVAVGINWYLQHYAGIDISWNNPTAKLPVTLPACERERHKASVDYRYHLNFCTYSYSMAFWDWNRWQQEIDWMALHGINLPLVITGMECVWRRVLTDSYGYESLDAVNEFVCGSGYYGWFFMNNLTAWGGPQPESWYTQQETLARKIFQRMREFGMKPVVPGYVGMIPENFLARASADKVVEWKKADIVSGGKWNQFVRPAFVNNTDRLKEFGAAYYAAFQALYGDVCNTCYFAIDPFHEGGVPSGVTNAKASVEAMWNVLTEYNPAAVWVAQHWQDNPTTLVTHSIPRGRLLILDLHGDSNGDTDCSGYHTTAAGEAHDWVWGQVSNFGGNVGLFGRVDRLINCFYAARDKAKTNHLIGIGALPEGIENNPMLYDLLYALPWTTTDYNRNSWLADYVRMRYGITPDDVAYETLLSVWKRLGAGIYNCPNNAQQGTTESVFLMRPALKPTTVSSWANSNWYWDLKDLRTALYEMLSVSEVLKDNDNYRYDLVELTRQALADYGKELLEEIGASSGTDREAKAQAFLSLILDQDHLLSTRSELRLGRWTAMARNLGNNTEEADLYERNARMLLTTWGDYAQCEQGHLHDYANREWAGLLSAYYYPRWKAFFANGCKTQPWFKEYEWPFAQGTPSTNVAYLPAGTPYAYGSFSSEADGDEIEIARTLYDKYFHDFQPEVWTRIVPDLEQSYRLTNVEAWYGSADSEGLCIQAPNADYSGYRLKRMALAPTDKGFEWRFVTSPTTEGAVKLQNVQLLEKRTASFLSSKPSSAAYPAFTFNAAGTDFYLYQCNDRYYLQEAGAETYMAPDTKWAEACVLVAATRSAASLLHLVPLVPSDIGHTITDARTAYTFDLQGRPVPRTTSHNIYIADGRKTFHP